MVKSDPAEFVLSRANLQFPSQFPSQRRMEAYGSSPGIVMKPIAGDCPYWEVEMVPEYLEGWNGL